MINVAGVIIPTTGSNLLSVALKSVLDQDMDTIAYVVVDGDEFAKKAKNIIDSFDDQSRIKAYYLNENIGADGFYGHRIYAAFSHLVNVEYVFFLDQDCWFDNDHVSSLVNLCKNKLWCHSLRKIVSPAGNIICNDDCESLGKYAGWQNYNLVDTNSYCVCRKFLINISAAWHGKWGQDRVFLNTCCKFQEPICTNKYSVNYRLGGNAGSVSENFFVAGNKSMHAKYKGEFPWNKKIC